MKIVHNEVKTLWFDILKARGPGKFCSLRMTGGKFRHGGAVSLELIRRAFLSFRVIQAQGKFNFNMAVIVFGKWVWKMEISQNP